MFGTYRTLLALMVVAFHLGGVDYIGGYAVFGFYTLSGYLMTLIMRDNYGYTFSGISKYAVNRFLRIYPLYWASIALSVILIYLVGERYASHYHQSIYLPRTITDVIKNIFIYFPSLESPRLTPPAWALTVEIFYYVLIGLGISRNKMIILLWLSISIIYHAVVNILGLGPDYFYFIIPAASLPFATGAFIYHYKTEILKYVYIVGGAAKEYLFAIIFCGILLNWFIAFIDEQFEGIYFYVNYVLCALMVAVLSGQKSLPFISRRFDKWMGDFSYPIYLIHYQVGLVVLLLMNKSGFDYHRPDLALMYVSIPVIFVVSWMLTVMVEQPVERVRTRIKNR
jgi:peptidoglycan/LPS O-acetylase OafA/YrhL